MSWKRRLRDAAGLLLLGGACAAVAWLAAAYGVVQGPAWAVWAAMMLAGVAGYALAWVGGAPRRADRRVREAIDRMPVMFDAFDEQGNIVFWNDECERVSGYSAQQIVGNPRAMQLLCPDPDYLEPMMREWKRRGNDYRDWEWDLTCPDGSVRTVAWSNVSDRAPIPGWASWGTGVDVTAQRRMERELAGSEQRFRMLVEHAADPFYLHDEEGRIVDVNRQACQSLGYTREELLRLRVWDVSATMSEAEVRAFWRSHARSPADPAVTFESVHRRKDGSAFPVEIRLRPFEAEGRTMMLALARDVTARREAERALRQSEARMKAAFDHVPFDFWACDAEGRYTMQNAVSIGNWGNHVGMTLDAIDLPQDVIEHWRRQNAEVYSGKIVREEKEYRRHGSTVHCLEVLAPVRDGEKVIGLVGVNVDITEQKRAEQAARAHAERLRLIAENTTVGIFQITPDWRIVHANPAMCRLLEVDDASELIGQSIRAFYDEADLEVIRREHAKRLEGASSTYEVDLVGRRGGRRRVMVCGSPLVNAEGELEVFFGTFTDITARVEAERQLRESERRFRGFFENTTVGVGIAKPDGRLVAVNQAFCDMLGYSEAEMLGQTIDQITHPDAGEASRQALSAYLAGEADRYEVEKTLKRRDGSALWVRVNASLVRDEQGDAQYLVGVVQDIHDRKLAKRRVVRQAKKLRRANHRLRDEIAGRTLAERSKIELHEQLLHAQKTEVIGQLAGGVTHDLNNLLTVLSAHIELVKDQVEQDNPLRQSIASMEEAVRQAASLLNSLLGASRRLRPSKREVDLAAAVAATTEMLERVLPKSIRLLVDMPAERKVMVYADEVQLQQAVLNLALNARDAMPGGGELRVSLELAPAREGDAGSNGNGDGNGRGGAAVVRLRISDTGCGMSESVRSRLFEPFFSTKPQGHGTGLGLPTVKSIVESHKGELEVISQPGHGATFVITLPVLGGDSNALNGSGASALSTAPPEGRGELVLLVEDSAQVRAVIAAWLVSNGYRVAQAASGEQMLGMFETRAAQARLLIVDMMLPGMSGTECVAQCRAVVPDLPAIIMTGRDDLSAHTVEDAQTILLRKPFEVTRLSASVGQLLSARPAP